MTLEQRAKDIETLLSILRQGWEDKKLFADNVPTLEDGAYDDDENEDFPLHYGWAGILNNLANLMGFESPCKNNNFETSPFIIDYIMSEANDFLSLIQHNNTKSDQ